MPVTIYPGTLQKRNSDGTYSDLVPAVNTGGSAGSDNNIADDYRPTTTYSMGDHVLYSGVLYRCISASGATGTWDSTKWDAVTVGEEVENIEGTIDDLESDILSNFAANYNASTSYTIGKYCIHDGQLYRCVAAIPSPGEAWNSSHWATTNISNQVYNTIIKISHQYNPARTYKKDEVCIYGDALKYCKIDMTEPEEWNFSHWGTVTGVMDVVGSGQLDSSFEADNLTGAANELKNTLNQLTRPNLLDNWYFVGGGSQGGNGKFPINQRGQTIYTNAGYGVDRWIYGTYTIGNSGITISANTMYQRLSDPDSYSGKTLTFSVLLSDGSLYSISGNPTTGFSGDGLGCAIDSGLNVLWVSISITGTAIVAVKLEIGSNQSLAHLEGSTWVLNEMPDYAEQMLRCCSSAADPSDTYANKPYNEVKNSFDFSTTQEVFCGTWDGVPLYRKVFIKEKTTSAWESLGSTGISQSKIKMTDVYAENNKISHPPYYVDSTDYFRAAINNGNLMAALGSSYPEKPINIIAVVYYIH